MPPELLPRLLLLLLVDLHLVLLDQELPVRVGGVGVVLQSHVALVDEHLGVETGGGGHLETVLVE